MNLSSLLGGRQAANAEKSAVEDHKRGACLHLDAGPLKRHTPS